MAIDTKNKRKSVIEVPGLTLYPDPDGGIDQNDRAIISSIYGGITFDVVASTQWAKIEDSTFSPGQSSNVSSTWVQDMDTTNLRS